MMVYRIRMFIVAVSAILQVCGVLARADYYTDYVWYRAMPDEDRILITVERLYGEKAVEHHVANSKALEAEGKYLTMRNGVGDRRVLKMSETLGGRRIETEISINYPRDRGPGGATAFVFIKVQVDGVPRMVAPLGYNHGYDLVIPHIQIHSSEHYGYITATALYAGDYHIERQNGEFHRLWLDSNEQLVIENAKLRRVPMTGEDKAENK